MTQTGPEPFVFGNAARRDAPATHRNRDAIAEVLRGVLPATGTVLEVAAGTGQHAVHFAALFPALIWQPTDPDPQALASIAAWRADKGSANLAAPMALDAASSSWAVEIADAILCVNMVHISPWAATEGLFAGAARVLPAGGPLVIYGPFVEEGVTTAASNIAFDRNLQLQDPQWGLRPAEALDQLASEHGMTLASRIAMPANNLVLIYRR